MNNKGIVLTDINQENQKCIEQNLYDIYDFFGSIGSNKLLKTAEYRWVNSKPFSWPNFIYNVCIPIENQELTIDEIHESIKTKIAPPFFLYSQLNKPNNLARILDSKGMRLIAEWPCIALQVNSLNQNYLKPNKFLFKHVQSDQELADWIRIASLELFKNIQLDFNVFKIAIKDERIKLFLGFINEKPVATTLSFYSSGVCGIYMCTTINQYRNIGVGKQMFIQQIIQAKNDGYFVTIAQASIMGLPSWLKLGFKIYYNIDLYWMVGKDYC